MRKDPSALRFETKGLSRTSYRSPRLNAIIIIPNCQTLLLVELQVPLDSPANSIFRHCYLGRLRFGLLWITG